MSKLRTTAETDFTTEEADDFSLKNPYWPDAVTCLNLLTKLSEQNRPNRFSPLRPLFVTNMNWRADMGQKIKPKREFFLAAGETHLIWGSNGAARKIFLVKEGQVHLSDREGRYLCTLGPGACYGRYYDVTDSIGGRDIMEWPRLPFHVVAGDYPQDNSALLQKLEAKAEEEWRRDPLIADLRAYFQNQVRSRLDLKDGEVAPAEWKNLQEQLRRAYLSANLAGAQRGAQIISLAEEDEDYARRFWSRIFHPTLTGYLQNQIFATENDDFLSLGERHPSENEETKGVALSANAWSLLFFLKTAYEFAAEPILQAYLPNADLKTLCRELAENGCIHLPSAIITGRGLHLLDCKIKGFDKLSLINDVTLSLSKGHPDQSPRQPEHTSHHPELVEGPTPIHAFLFSYFSRTEDWFNAARVLARTLESGDRKAEIATLFRQNTSFQNFLLQADNFLEGDLHLSLLNHWLENTMEKQKLILSSLASVAYYKQQDYPGAVDYADKVLSSRSSETKESAPDDSCLTPDMVAQLIFLRKESLYSLNRFEEAAASSPHRDFDFAEPQEREFLSLASKATALAITTAQKETLNQTMLELAEKMEGMATNLVWESLPPYFRLMICGELQRLRLRGCKARKEEEFTQNLQLSISWGAKAKNLPAIKPHDLQPPFVNQALALERVGDFAGSISIMKEAAVKLVNPLTGEKYEAWARYLYNTAHLFGSRIESITNEMKKSTQKTNGFSEPVLGNLSAIQKILEIISKEADFCVEGEKVKYAGIISKIEAILAGEISEETQQATEFTALDEVFYELWRLYFRINSKASRFADEHQLPYPAVISHANATRSLREIRSLIALRKKQLQSNHDQKSQDLLRELEIHAQDAREKTAEHLQKIFLVIKNNYWKRNFLNIRPLDEIFSHLVEHGLSLSKELVDILNQMKAGDVNGDMIPEIQDFAREAFGFRDSFLDFYSGLSQRAEDLAQDPNASKGTKDFFTSLRQLRRDVGILRRS